MSVYKKALIEVREILGTPCSANKCDGCRWEMGQATLVISKALPGKYIRKAAKRTGHKK